MNLPNVPCPEYVNAVISRNYDGDTFFVTVELPPKVSRQTVTNQPIRLLGLNAAELHTPGGDAAAANMATLLPVGTPIVLMNVGEDKFAPRWDCSVVYLAGGVATDLTTTLVMQGWAAPWNGVGTKPVPPWPRVVPPQTVRGVLNRAVAEWNGVPWS